MVEIVVPDRPRSAAALERAFAAIAKVHAVMSAHDRSSDLGILHSTPLATPTRVDPWTWRVLSAAQRLHRITEGAFDPIAAGRLAVAAGRLPDWPGRPPASAASWSDVEILPRFRVSLRHPMRFDLGGIAKGFAVDRSVAALRAAGLPWSLVNAGGDVRAFGSRAWPIHVRHPAAPGALVPIGFLHNQALATSAPYFSAELRSGRPTSALFDPATGNSVVDAVSVSVFAPTCLTADALTKAVLLKGDIAALSECRASALIVTSREKVEHAA